MWNALVSRGRWFSNPFDAATTWSGAECGELLESRDLLSTTPYIDLIPGPDGSNAIPFAVVGDTLYFQGGDGTRYGLWATDGTTGTRFVLDGSFGLLGKAADRLFVTRGGQQELFSISGSSVQSVGQLTRGFSSFSIAVGGELYFDNSDFYSLYNAGTLMKSSGGQAVEAIPGFELALSDYGTSNAAFVDGAIYVVGSYAGQSGAIHRLIPGATTATRVLPSPGPFSAQSLTCIEDQLVFVGNGSLEKVVPDGFGGEKAQRVTPSGFSVYNILGELNGRAIVTGYTDATGSELFSVDVSSGQYRLVRDIAVGPGSIGHSYGLGPLDWAFADDRLFFSVYQGAYASLWSTTGAGAVELQRSSGFSYLPVGDTMYFGSGGQLFRSDGTVAGTAPVNAKRGVYYKGSLVYQDFTDEYGTELYATPVSDSGGALKVSSGGASLQNHATLDFGLLTIGAGPGLKTVTIRNTGVGPLVVQPPTVSGPFSLVGSLAPNQSLDPGDSVELSLRFDPGALGAYAGQLTFVNSDANENLFSVTLSASVQNPTYFQDDGDAAFATSGLWSAAGGSGYGNPKDFRYATNSGGLKTATWTFNGLSAGQYRVSASWIAATNRATNAPFAVFNGAGGPALGTVTLNQRVAANDRTDAGTPFEDLGLFTITGNALVVQLSNIAADGIVIADAIRLEHIPAPEIVVLDGTTNVPAGAGSVNYGTTTLGTSIDKTFTISNTGTAALTLSAPTLTGPFSLVGSFPATIAPGGSAAITVRMSASTLGPAGGAISFANNDGDENPFNFALTGTVAPLPPPPTFVDDGDAGFTTTGLWSAASGAGYGNPKDFRYATNSGGLKTATWTFNGLSAGQYRVSASWFAAANRARNAPYTVFDGAGGPSLGTVTMNQRVAANDRTAGNASFEDLGLFTITGTTLVVRLSNTPTDGIVIADAIRVERLAARPATTTDRPTRIHGASFDASSRTNGTSSAPPLLRSIPSRPFASMAPVDSEVNAAPPQNPAAFDTFFASSDELELALNDTLLI